MIENESPGEVESPTNQFEPLDSDPRPPIVQYIVSLLIDHEWVFTVDDGGHEPEEDIQYVDIRLHIDDGEWVDLNTLESELLAAGVDVTVSHVGQGGALSLPQIRLNVRPEASKLPEAVIDDA